MCATVQIAYTILSAVLTVGWYYAGSARRSGMARNTHRQAPANASTAPKRTQPHLTILIPSAGGRARVLHHWASLLDLQYSGTIEVVILVHSRDDPSFCIAEQLLRSSDGRVKVCVTGHASSCSQKIHKCSSFQAVPRETDPVHAHG